MDKEHILLTLLSLSRSHHRFALEERWEQWEIVADQKEELLGKIEEAGKNGWNTEERRILADIANLEEQTTSELQKKRRDTRDRLIRVNRVKRAMKGYGKFESRGPGRHFAIKC